MPSAISRRQPSLSVGYLALPFPTINCKLQFPYYSAFWTTVPHFHRLGQTYTTSLFPSCRTSVLALFRIGWPQLGQRICSIFIYLSFSGFVVVIVLDLAPAGAHAAPHMAGCAAVAAAVGWISGILSGSFAHRTEDLALSKTFRTAFHIVVLPSASSLFSDIFIGPELCRSR